MTCRLRREFRRYAGTLPLTRSSSHLGSGWTDGPNDNGASTDSLTAKKWGDSCDQLNGANENGDLAACEQNRC